MTYQIFNLPPQQPLSAAGRVLPGSKLYFYLTTTTTPTPVYTTSALSVAHSQPLIADGGGRFAAVYLDPTIEYKATVTDANDVLLYTIDPVNDQLLSAALIGATLYPRTAAEISAGVTPTNYFYPPLVVDRYGTNTTPGTTDMRTAFASAIDVATVSGGVVYCIDGVAYQVTNGGTTYDGITGCVVVKENVTLDLCGATLTCTVGTGNQVAVWLRGDRAKIRNGTVNAVSSGSPSSQFFFHASISIGSPNNTGDTVASPSVGQFMIGWAVENMQLSTTRTRCPVIQGMGGISEGLIDNIIIPTSTTHSGVHFDWGNVGTVSSSAISTTRASFDANTAYTTHPHNIKIRNLQIGTLSAAVSGDTGTCAVRLSGCYGIEVENVEVDSCTLAAYFHTAGDLGFEFAPANVKRHACKGNTARNITVLDASSSMLQGAFIDTLADNIYREQFLNAYSPLMNPLHHGSVVISGRFMGGNVDNTYGVRVTQARGVKVEQVQAQRWYYGIFIDEFSQDVDVDDCDVTANRREGVKIGFAQLREGTERISLWRNKSYANGTDAACADIRVTRGKVISIQECTCGVAGTTQTFGILVDDVATIRDIRIDNNHVLGAATAAYGLAGSSPTDQLKYRVITSFSGNTVAAGVTTLVSGMTYLPVYGRLIGNSRQQMWLNPNSAAPSDGTWYAGDDLDQSGPAASTQAGHKVVTSGSFGTLASITNCATTNTSKDITCSLTGLTVNTTQAAYSVTVSSATDIRPGMKCSIAAAGITNAEILSVSGTTLQLDTQANATQTGGTFTTCGLIEGEVISIDTTTPIAGAVVMKINGTTVSLSVAASDTQSSRTVSYTTPVFKARASLAA